MTQLYPKASDLNYQPQKYFYTYSPIDCKKMFFKGNPEITNNNYTHVVYVFFKCVVAYMFETKLSFYFPNGIGRLYIRMFKPKKYFRNPGESKKLGRTVYALSIKWGGRFPQLKWEKTEGHYRNRAYLNLKLEPYYKDYFTRYKQKL